MICITDIFKEIHEDVSKLLLESVFFLYYLEVIKKLGWYGATLVFQPPCLVEPYLFQTAGRFQPAVSKNVVELKAFYNDIIAGIRIF